MVQTMVEGKKIKELADELGVSKTAIRNYMDDAFRAKYTAKDSKGVITINPDGCKLLSENLCKQTENTGKSVPETELLTIPRSVWQLMEDQIREKDKQLEAKDTQITNLTLALENTTASLQAAQALHAGTIQTQLLPEGEPVHTEQTKRKAGILSWLFGKGE